MRGEPFGASLALTGMTTGFVIRPARPEDAEAVAALRRVVFPYKVMTADTVQHTISADRPLERQLLLVAENAGTVVGWGKVGLNVWTSATGQSSTAVFVHPHHRRQGIGSALADRLHAHLAHNGARRTQLFVQQDSADFARHRGYEITRTMHYAGAELSQLPDAPKPPGGVELRAYDELDPRAAYTAEMLASSDETSDAPLDSMSYEQWTNDFWTDPAIDRKLSVAAVSGGTVLSFTLAERDGDRLWSAFSGTVPGHRGRGLAKLVKAAALHRAAAAGVAAAYTSNDERNAPMLAVNDWLGYRRTATELGAARTL